MAEKKKRSARRWVLDLCLEVTTTASMPRAGMRQTGRIDAVVVASKHNIQYLIGGQYRFFFFSHFDAIG